MASDGSVAPRERVNIVYKSEVGDQQQEVELPLRFLVAGDFTGRADATPVEQRDLVNVDKDNLDDVLAAHRVRVQVAVADHLSGEPGAELAVSLDVNRMADFSPDAICRQVPELAALVALRDALTVLKGPLGNVPAFRKRLQGLLEDPTARRRLLAELGSGDEPAGAGGDGKERSDG